MTERERLEVGNNTVEANGEFADGYCNGSLYYYDKIISYHAPQPVRQFTPLWRITCLTNGQLPGGTLDLSSGGLRLCVRTIQRFSLPVSLFLIRQS